MVNWKELDKGERLVMRTYELGQRVVVPCSVSEVYQDHIILEADGGYNLWLDDDFAEIFFRRKE